MIDEYDSAKSESSEQEERASRATKLLHERIILKDRGSTDVAPTLLVASTRDHLLFLGERSVDLGILRVVLVLIFARTSPIYQENVS